MPETRIETNIDTPATMFDTTELRVEQPRALRPSDADGVVRWSSARSLKGKVVIADAAGLIVGFGLAFAAQRALKPIPSWLVLEHIGLAAASLPAFAVGAAMNKLYLARANERPIDEATHVIKTVLTGLLFLIAISVGLKYEQLSRLWIGLSAASVTAAVLVERQIVRSRFAELRSRGKLRRRILIVGTDAHAIGLLHAYRRRPELGYEVIGLVGPNDIGTREGVGVIGEISDLEELMVEHRAVGVSVSLPGVDEDDVNYLTRRLTDRGYHVTLSSSLRDISMTRLRPQLVDGRTLLYVEPTLRGGWRAAAKRVFDVAAAGGGLLVLMPLLVSAAVAIKLTSRGPVLFRQQRVGRNGELFDVLKLRTMVADAEQRLDSLRHLNEADGVLFKMRRDPRVTTVGRVLRKLSIDELPQLWNVLRGEMSMVGPRPMLPAEADKLDAVTRAERVRVPPGVTGLWQVSGRAAAEFQNCRLDRYYVDNWTLGHDLMICVRTIPAVILGRGAA